MKPPINKNNMLYFISIATRFHSVEKEVICYESLEMWRL